jgi:hypothetical protein
MNKSQTSQDKKGAFVLKEFTAQKDKSTNDSVKTLHPLSAVKADETEAKLKQDTIGESYWGN